jgi:hypothetical protein
MTKHEPVQVCLCHCILSRRRHLPRSRDVFGQQSCMHSMWLGKCDVMFGGLEWSFSAAMASGSGSARDEGRTSMSERLDRRLTTYHAKSWNSLTTANMGMNRSMLSRARHVRLLTYCLLPATDANSIFLREAFNQASLVNGDSESTQSAFSR